MEIKLRASLAWWVRPYVFAIFFFSLIHGVEPDYEKLHAKLLKGIKLKVISLT